MGSRLVTALFDDGHHVVAATRNPERLAEFGWYSGVTAVALDTNYEASARAAFAEAGPIDVLYYLVHGIGQPGFRDADNVAAANVAVAAKNAGVERIVFLGGFVPDDEDLSEHLSSRAEVAHALRIDGGPEVVRLGAAMIIGSGSTSFEMLRYVGDRFVLIPMPQWVDNPMDPISISDVLYYLVAAADPSGSGRRLRHLRAADHHLPRPAGGLRRATGKWRAGLPIRGVTGAVSWMTAAVLPLPGGLAADLVESLDHSMMASIGLRDQVPTRREGCCIDERSPPCRVTGRGRSTRSPIAPPRRHRPRGGRRRSLRIHDCARSVTRPSPAGARSAGAVPGPSPRAANRTGHADQPRTEGGPA